MARKRRRFTADFKAKVAMEAIRGRRTVAELAGAYEVHPNQVTQWKKQLQEGASDVFGQRREADASAQAELTDRLYQQIGQLKVELDWLKKTTAANLIGEIGCGSSMRGRDCSCLTAR